MTAKNTHLEVDFTDVDEESKLYDVLKLAEEVIREEPEWDDSQVAQFVASEPSRLYTTKDNKDLKTLAELRKHDTLDDSELDIYQPKGYNQSGASGTIEAIIKRSIHTFVYERIIETPTNN